MSKSLSFKDYLSQSVLEETAIPTVWKKKFVNTVPEEEESAENQEDELDVEDEVGAEEDLGIDDEIDMGDEMDMGDELGMEDEPEEPEDPDRMGVIRKVTGAHLVYKRQDEEGTYEELWMYKVDGGVKDELEVRRDILAGTDIPQGKTKSEDKTQEFELWTSGNVQFLHITGLPN